MECFRRILVLTALLLLATVGARAAGTSLISMTNTWRYNQSGADLSGQFQQTAYDDSAWALGQGLLGVDTSSPFPYLYPVRTPLTTSAGRITYYFRTHFDFTNDPAGLFLVLTNLLDDGAVVYLNGTELYRARMPGGPITAATQADVAVPSTVGSVTLAEGMPVVLTFVASILKPGDNVLAAEVHQFGTSSTDVMFGLSLTARTNAPDLVIREDSVQPRIETHVFAPGDCEVLEGCGIPGTRKLLRFDTVTRNIGSVDLYLGNPVGNPNYKYDSCHGHFHYQGFADYRLVDLNGAVVAVGNKVGFCLEDLERFDPTATTSAAYFCDNQGIQRGWGDIYNSALPCQYVDITDVPTGTYTLELEIDPDNRLAEANETNNIIRTTVVLSAPCTVPPPNDTLLGALVVPYRSATMFTDSECATREAGEPFNPVNDGGKSVWFRWTAPYSGNAVFNTVGSNFDTILALYRGASFANLTLVATNDDSGGNLTSQISVTVTNGTIYQISVDGYDGEGGNVVLNINPGGNDLLTNCVVLSGVAGSVGGSTTGTAKEASEPNHAGLTGGHSIWYCWTAPASGAFLFDTAGSRFDTLLAVYTGTSVALLTPVAANDNSGAGTFSRVSFNAVAGTTYRIALDGKNGSSGVCVLNWRAQPQAQLASPSRTPGSFQFNLLTAPGERCWIDTSSNAVLWTPWLRVTNATGNMLLTDPFSMNVDRRFYKARTD